MAKISIKGRFFGYNPSELQELSDLIRDKYRDRIAISRPNPTNQDDFVVLFTIYGGADHEL